MQIMNYLKIILLVAAVVLLVFSFSSCSNAFKKKMISNLQTVDINRFTGTWYEIARFPHRFERNLVGVTATYNMLEDGMIEVLNKGYKNTLDGEEKVAIGKAKLASDNGKGHLKVSFFWIFYADYLVLELEPENYQYALIGSSTPNYLWILCREPFMEQSTLDRLLKRAGELGFDLSKVEMVSQKKPE
jgi:lipocalin